MDKQSDKPPTAMNLKSLRLAQNGDFPVIVALSRDLGVFTPEECDSLAIDLSSCDLEAGDRIVVRESAESPLSGFIQFSPAPITKGTWYVYWIAVSRVLHGQGVGSSLLSAAEGQVLALGGRQVVIETSASSLFDSARSFYLRNGYDLIARIPDYYSDGDDKCIFLKRL